MTNETDSSSWTALPGRNLGQVDVSDLSHANSWTGQLEDLSDTMHGGHHCCFWDHQNNCSHHCTHADDFLIVLFFVLVLVSICFLLYWGVRYWPKQGSSGTKPQNISPDNTKKPPIDNKRFAKTLVSNVRLKPRNTVYTL